MVATLDGVKDIVDPEPKVSVTVHSNGEDHRHHRLDKEDWKVTQHNGRWEVWLRSEKLFKEREERTYTIDVQVTDKYSNVASTNAIVEVPHDMKHRDSRDKNDSIRDTIKI